MKYCILLPALLAFCTGATAQSAEPSCPTPLLATGFDGERLSGDEASLIRAAEEGAPLRIGWAVDFDDDGVGDLVHWSNAVFISVFEGRVFSQVQAIHRQRPRLGQATIELPDQMDLWHGLISSDGVLQGRLEGEETASRRQVMTVWCPSESAAPSSPEWISVYRSGIRGEALSGSKDALLKAVRAGNPIRVGWGLKRERDGVVRSVEHTADPVFLTIVDETDIVVQLPEHVAQQSYWDMDKAFFDDASVMWRGVISTKGTFDAIWVNRATGELVRRSPQRAMFTWYVHGSPRLNASTLAVPGGATSDADRESDRVPK